MKFIKDTSIVLTFLAVFILSHSFINEASARGRGGRHHGPPPEAYTACEGKTEGDTAEFESPRGDLVTGTCEAEGDRLVLRPDNPPQGDRPNNADE